MTSLVMGGVAPALGLLGDGIYSPPTSVESQTPPPGNKNAAAAPVRLYPPRPIRLITRRLDGEEWKPEKAHGLDGSLKGYLMEEELPNEPDWLTSLTVKHGSLENDKHQIIPWPTRRNICLIKEGACSRLARLRRLVENVCTFFQIW